MELVVTRISEVTAHGAKGYDGKMLKNEQQDFDAYMKDCYKQLNISYPKFYKMDRLSKLCFIAAEILLEDYEPFQQYERDKIGVILENYHSSMDADLRHFESIRDKDHYFPSPAVFVYTLPNIMIGELCIRHRITGEGSCFLLQDSDFMKNYITELFLREGYECCITGKVDYFEGKYDAKLYLIEKTNSVEKHILKFDSVFSVVPRQRGTVNMQ